MNNVNDVSTLKDIPVEKKDDINLLIQCIKQKRLDLIEQFNPIVFTEKIINEYGVEIINLGLIPFCLSNNSKLLKLCLDLNCKFDLVNSFGRDAFTDNILEEYGAKIVSIFSSKGIPFYLKDNSKLLRLCLDLNKLDLIDQFNDSAFTDNIIEEYGAKIVGYGKIPFCLSNNSKLLRLCLDLDRLDLMDQFSDSAFTDNIIEEYGAKIINSNYIRASLRGNSKLLRSCLDLDRLDLIDVFDDSTFTDSIIEEYGAKIINSNKISSNLRGNLSLFKLCLKLYRFDLLKDFCFQSFPNNNETCNEMIEFITQNDIINSIKQFGIKSVYYLSLIHI